VPRPPALAGPSPSPIISTQDPRVVATTAFSTEVQPGDVLVGKYRVERVLGAGGMGVVVEATHLLLSERVALKFLLPHALGDEAANARFLREAQAAARIKSNHVARVTDVGELRTGSPYIVMEFLEGQSLDELFEADGRLEVELACELTLQACEGLAAAHAVGVIHRDVKPSNLFVTKANDGSTQLKVLDFGISKVLQPANSLIDQLTQTQVTMGSPLFMSPEQMRSSRGVDARSDVWSLGIVLYEALTGRSPFDADSLPQLCAMVLEGECTPISELLPQLPPQLAEAIMRCLCTAPDDRFQNVAEMAQALAPFGGPEGSARAARCQRILHGQSQDSLAPAKGSSQSPTLNSEPALPTKTGTTFERTAPPSSGRQLPLVPLIAGAVAVITTTVAWWVMRQPSMSTDALTVPAGPSVAGMTATPTAPVAAAAATTLPPPVAAPSVAEPAATESMPSSLVKPATSRQPATRTAPLAATAAGRPTTGLATKPVAPRSPAPTVPADDPFAARK
jgi:serine/threonine protein kinase